MRHSFTDKRTIARGLVLAAAALTLGAAACSDDDATDDTTNDAATATDTAADAESPTTDANSPADDADAAASHSEEAPDEGDDGDEGGGEPFTMTQGSTTVTVSPAQNVPLNERITVTWNSEGHASCGTMVTFTTPDDLLLRMDPNAGCSGEFSERLDESLGATAGTYILTLMGTPDGDIEVPIEVS